MIIATSSPINWKLGAEAIKFYQKTNFSHVLIIKDDLVYQASHGLVHSAYIDNFLLGNKIINFYEVPDNIVDMEFVHKQLGKEYSIEQLILLPILRLVKAKWSGNGDQKFICSEFVGKALKLDWVGELTTPKEIDDYLRQTWLK